MIDNYPILSYAGTNRVSDVGKSSNRLPTMNQSKFSRNPFEVNTDKLVSCLIST